MEFSYKSYYIRYAINPADFILRFEDKNNRKLYEGVFYEPDFKEYSILGGFDFVSNLIIEAFQQTNAFVSVNVCELKETDISCTIEVALSILPKPIHISLHLAQIRRESVSDDLNDLSCKVIRNEDTMNAKFIQYDQSIQSIQTTITTQLNKSDISKNENRLDNNAIFYDRLFTQEKKTEQLIKLSDRVAMNEKALEQFTVTNTRIASIFEHMKQLKNEISKGLEQARLLQKTDNTKLSEYTLYTILHSDIEESIEKREAIEKQILEYIMKGLVPYAPITNNEISHSITFVKHNSIKNISGFKIIYGTENEIYIFEQSVKEYLSKGWCLFGNGYALTSENTISSFLQFLIKYE